MNTALRDGLVEVPGARDKRSTLISASCTTSWFDWIHGELWLCPNGLLRRSLCLVATLRHGGGPTLDTRNRPTRDFTQVEIDQIVARGRRNRWIPWSAITKVTLKRGIMDHSLHIELGDRRRERFLWLKVDGGWETLEHALAVALPGRFIIYDEPV